MRTEIQDIPMEVLLEDKAASLEDIGWCGLAKVIGVDTERLNLGEDMTLDKRMDINAQMVEVIDAEIQRREDEHQVDS